MSGPHGGVGNGAGLAIAISAGGRYRVFISSATNLVAGDTNAAWDVFIRDRHTGKTVRVDLTATGGQANHGIGKIVPGAVAVTAGARWLAFVSPSTNLHPPNANSLIHAYLRGPSVLDGPLWPPTLPPSGRRRILTPAGGSAGVHPKRGKYVCEPGRGRADDVCRGRGKGKAPEAFWSL